MKTDRFDEPLECTVFDNGVLVVSIGINTLAHAAKHSPYVEREFLFDNDTGDIDESKFEVTNNMEFAEDVRNQILDEREDGSSKLSDLLDWATQAAIENGSLNVRYPELDALTN